MRNFWLSLFAICLGTPVFAKTYKIGTMIPEGTSYSNLLKEMGKKIRSETKGKVKFKFVMGGVAGDERDVVNKIRVGQFHGGVFTAKTIADAYGDVRIMEIPFSFKDRSHSQQVLKDFMPHFEKGLRKSGFESLGLYETGEIYMVSKNDIKDVKGLKDQKLWLYNGDSLAEAFIKSMDLVAVPVTLPDVLSSLSTGLINTAYAPSIGIVALQWQSKVSYLIEPPFAYHFQGFLLSSRAWRKIPIDIQKTVKRITSEYAKKISDDNIKEAAKALAIIKKQGVKVIQWPASDLEKLKSIRTGVLKELTGKVLSQDIVKQFKTKM